MAGRRKLTKLLVETGRAHHEAFIDTDGDDPEWPLWYAEYLKEPVRQLLDVELTSSELVFLLVGAARDHQPEDRPWAEFYAKRIIDSVD